MKRWTPIPDGVKEHESGHSENESEAVSQSVDDLLTQEDFQKLLLIICQAVYRRLNLGRYDPAYGREDLFGDACEKLLKSRQRFRPDDIPNEKALFSWLYVLAFNRGLSKLREIKRQRPWLFPGKAVEELPEEDSGINLEREWAARELMGFMKSLPDERRRALVLRLEGNSYREVAQILEGEGIKVSHVTVQKWVEAGLQFVLAKAS
jgi:RNA polymerase sigma factor (sigma-70 family)